MVVVLRLQRHLLHGDHAFRGKSRDVEVAKGGMSGVDNEGTRLAHG